MINKIRKHKVREISMCTHTCVDKKINKQVSLKRNK